MNYAVMVSMPGCLPDYFAVFTTLRDARDEAQFQKEQFLDEGYTVCGNKKDGYLVYRDADSAYPCNVIEIVETEEEPEE